MDLLQLCEEIEFPLIAVLARMEACGDRPSTSAYLAGMSKDLERQLQNLVTDIHRAAGGAFNINSTQQLGEILFTQAEAADRPRRPRPAFPPTSACWRRSGGSTRSSSTCWNTASSPS